MKFSEETDVTSDSHINACGIWLWKEIANNFGESFTKFFTEENNKFLRELGYYELPLKVWLQTWSFLVKKYSQNQLREAIKICKMKYPDPPCPAQIIRAIKENESSSYCH